MNCPYCGKELSEWNRQFYCGNLLCSAKGVELPKFLWQDLISGKKAQDSLIACKKHISDIIAEWNRHAQDHKPNPRQMVIFACRARDEIAQSLNKIQKRI